MGLRACVVRLFLERGKSLHHGKVDREHLASDALGLPPPPTSRETPQAGRSAPGKGCLPLPLRLGLLVYAKPCLSCSGKRCLCRGRCLQAMWQPELVGKCQTWSFSGASLRCTVPVPGGSPCGPEPCHLHWGPGH